MMKRGFSPLETIEKHKKIKMSLTGFTMVELMLVIGIFVFVITGLLAGYIGCLSLNSLNRNLTSALNICRLKIEELRNMAFNSIINTSIDSATLENSYGFAGSLNIEVLDVTPLGSFEPVIKDIRVVACWREAAGRIVGEDVNLDGVFNLTQEDANRNSRLDSPCVIETSIAKE